MFTPPAAKRAFNLRPRPRHCGFSLVELSIVLVILGLLVGGVLSGQSMIKAAELRAISTEYSQIISSTQQFKDKYFALPGDFNSATRFWLRENFASDEASAAPLCGNNAGAARHATEWLGACDGDGDGRIRPNDGVLSPDEGAQFWQHLFMAGLIEMPNRTGPGKRPGLNFGSNEAYKSSRYPNGLWAVFYSPARNASWLPVDTWHGTNVQLISFGALWGNTQPTTTNLLNPQDAYNIDIKSDDGKPQSGMILSRWGVTCYSGTEYVLTASDAQCALVYKNPF